MEYFMAGEYLFLASIYGKDGCRLFESEIHKKKLLDAVREMATIHGKNDKKRINIYAYCILDDEGIFLLGMKEEEDRVQSTGILREVMYRYKRMLSEISFAPKELEEWEFREEAVEQQDFWNRLVTLHYLPVKKGYTIWPEHYWWSSFLEYMGRSWMEYQIPELFQRTHQTRDVMIRDIRREHREWKNKHPEVYLSDRK